MAKVFGVDACGLLDFLNLGFDHVRVGLRNAPGVELRIERPDEAHAFGARFVQHPGPLRRAQDDGCEDGRGHRDRIGRKCSEELDRKLRTGDGTGGRRAKLRVDLVGVGSDLHQRQLGGRRGKIVSAREQLDQLPPAHGAIVRIGRGLGQNCVQAIVETHAISRFLKTGRNHRSRGAASYGRGA